MERIEKENKENENKLKEESKPKGTESEKKEDKEDKEDKVESKINAIKEESKEKKEKEEETKDEKTEEEKEEPKEKVGIEVPVKSHVGEKLGLKNMIDDSFILSTVKTWDELGVKPEIHKGLLSMDFITPSKIQSTTFPLIIKNLV